MEQNIDIKENYIYQLDANLLAILILDKSSGKNIIWATDNYAERGFGYQSSDQIMVDSITHRNGSVIKPRTTKSKKEQAIRVRDKAEVFTPSWVCNNQNNLVDNAWFGRENVFNTENSQTWITSAEKITFPEGRTWQDYVKANRMEISCGEAPYLASRYDTVTGKWIEVRDRIGILDRKIRIVNENTETEQDWMKWVIKAFQSVYGFEWQGDSLLIARENLLFSFIDYYTDRFTVPLIKKLREVISLVMSMYYQALDSYHRLNITNRNLYRENEHLRKDNGKLLNENKKLVAQNRDCNLFRKVFGSKQIDEFLTKAKEPKQSKQRDERFRKIKIMKGRNTL